MRHHDQRALRLTVLLQSAGVRRERHFIYRMNRNAELEPPSRVACSNLLGISASESRS